MAIASDRPDSYSRSQLQTYGWRAFCVEFLCGTLVVAWYLLSLAERTTLRGLTQLEKFAAPSSDDLSGYGEFWSSNVNRTDDSGRFSRVSEDF